MTTAKRAVNVGKKATAVGSRIDRTVGRPVPERAQLMRQLTNAQREVRTWPEWMTANATMPRWMLEWDDHA